MEVCCRFLSGLMVCVGLYGCGGKGFPSVLRVPPLPLPLARVVRALGLAVLAVGVVRAWPSFRAVVFAVSSFSASFVLPVGFVRSAPVAAPVAVAPAVAFVPFAPASLSLGRSGSVPASRFVPVASGVVASVGWCPRRSGVLVSLASGASFCCLVSGLPGGFGGPAAVSLAASVRSALASGAVVSVLGAPGARGSVCSGYFCGLAAL